MNNSKPFEISPELWAEFAKTEYYKILLNILEGLRDENLKLSMGIADKTIMPNESIAAYVNRAMGVQIAIDHLSSLTIQSQETLKQRAKKGKAVNGM